MTFQWPGGDNETLQYRYDGAGNRLQEAWDNGVTIDYRYLPGNYLAEVDSVVQSERDNATVEYVYNARQQLAQVKHNDTVIAQFFYDALGRRIKAVEGNTTTITLYAGNDVVYEEKATSSTPTRKTCYLVVNGQYLAKTVRDGSNPPEKYFYHTDLVGSIRAITNMAGQVVASLTYEPFGRERSISGSTDPHRFTGKPLDATELYYFGARYYDPDLGRFITRDPAQDGLNWYEYCRNNPNIFTDSSGEYAIKRKPATFGYGLKSPLVNVRTGEERHEIAFNVRLYFDDPKIVAAKSGLSFISSKFGTAITLTDAIVELLDNDPKEALLSLAKGLLPEEVNLLLDCGDFMKALKDQALKYKFEKKYGEGSASEYYWAQDLRKKMSSILSESEMKVFDYELQHAKFEWGYFFILKHAGFL